VADHARAQRVAIVVGAAEAGGAPGVRVGVREFVAGRSGEYHVRMVRPAGAPPDTAEYQLVATRRASFDPASAADTDVTRTGVVLGSSRGPGVGETGTPVTLATNLFDGEGWRWDIGSDGSIADGTRDAYDVGVRLRDFRDADGIGTRGTGGREIDLGPARVSSTDGQNLPLDLSRSIYVSPTRGFTRFLETVCNVGDRPATYRLRVDSNLGSGGEFTVPLWLVDKYATAGRAGRPFGDLLQPMMLPPGVSSIHTPRMTTGTIAGTGPDSAASPSQDVITVDASSTVVTIDGMADIHEVTQKIDDIIKSRTSEARTSAVDARSHPAALERN
jgi:hypothetical protein